MHIIMAVLSLALLIWAQPASAQATYTATVSVHRVLPPLSKEDVTTIMDAASRVLKKPGGDACAVTFKLKGPVGRFGSKTTPPVIENEQQRDAVHNVDSHKAASFHIKVVEAINYCVGSSVYTGCAWPAQLPSIIVVHPAKLPNNYPHHLLWVHEFGHLTGRSHRTDPDKDWLMTCSGVAANSVKVTGEECGCLLLGPGGCGVPTPKGCAKPNP